MSIDARIAAAKGTEPCPLCGSADVRWRGRRPTDFVLTWLRYVGELFASVFASGELRQYHSRARAQGCNSYADFAAMNDVRAGVHDTWRRLGDESGEMLEATTSHKTPKRFWSCRACKREGHVF